MQENEVEGILKKAKTIAIVGLSDKPERDSYDVAMYLKKAGYRIIPINPNISGWNGIKAYPSLAQMEASEKTKVDVVDIFRKSDAVGELVEEVLKMVHKPLAVWMQLGVINKEAAEKARKAGIKVVVDRCMKVEHQALL